MIFKKLFISLKMSGRGRGKKIVESDVEQSVEKPIARGRAKKIVESKIRATLEEPEVKKPVGRGRAKKIIEEEPEVKKPVGRGSSIRAKAQVPRLKAPLGRAKKIVEEPEVKKPVGRGSKIRAPLGRAKKIVEEPEEPEEECIEEPEPKKPASRARTPSPKRKPVPELRAEAPEFKPPEIVEVSYDHQKSKDAKYLHRLKLLIDRLLEPIIPKAEQRKFFTSEESMAIWKTAFTHETVSPTDNYEDLEFLGDAVLKAVYPEYLMERFPELHKGEYTELNIEYMSKIRQAELSRKMHLTDYIRVQGLDRAILNLETDVFESFMGALNKIANLRQRGLGYIYCYNMITHLFEDIEIDTNRGKGSVKTQVQQMFSRFDLQKPNEIVPGHDVKIVVTPEYRKIIGQKVLGNVEGVKKHAEALPKVSKIAIETLTELGVVVIEESYVAQQSALVECYVTLSPEHLKFLKQYGVKIQPQIGYGQAPTLKEAEYKAYQMALKTLNDHGIDSDWADQAKQRRDFSDELILPHLAKAFERLQSEGFMSMYFFIPRKTVTKRGSIVQLVGAREDGTDAVIEYVYTADKRNGYQIAKAQLIENYARG